jgi:hypothetical protein
MGAGRSRFQNRRRLEKKRTLVPQAVTFLFVCGGGTGGSGKLSSGVGNPKLPDEFILRYREVLTGGANNSRAGVSLRA